MNLSFEQAVERLKGGESIDSLLVAFRSPSDISVQRAAALVPSFDHETFNVFGAGADFDAFVKQPFVELVPGTEETYRVSRDYRATLLNGWIGTNEWRECNTSLATFFHNRVQEGSADELRHLSALGAD